MAKTTIIYCLKNPIDHNRIFYVGKTVLKLNVRLSGHIRNPSNSKMAAIIAEILQAGKRPTIHQLEVCTTHTQVYQRERYWVKRYNRRRTKLANRMLTRKKKKTNHFYW